MATADFTPAIDFTRIRSHRGTAASGFEELAVQLFRAEYESTGEVRRVEGSGGDTGVEAFVLTSPNREVGIQAKFFDRLSSSQWTQIKKSIARAAAEHPKLKRYIVAVPLDRNPTQQKTWNTIVRSYRKRLKLVWWGASEIHDFLTAPLRRGLLLYWFGFPDFTIELFRRQNEVARKALDDRYTPTRHVKTDGQLLLEAFTSRQSFLEAFLVLASNTIRAWRGLRSFGKSNREKKNDKKLVSAKRDLDVAWRILRDVFGKGATVPPLSELSRVLLAFGEQLNHVRHRLLELERDWQDQKKSTDQSPHSWRLHELREMTQAWEDLSLFVKKFSPAEAQFLLIDGEGGIGKSHLIASVVEEMEAANQWALLTLGEFFRSSADPWEQFLSHIGWQGSPDDFLQLLNQASASAGRPGLLCIDALNETPHRQLWRTRLLSFAAKLNDYPHVKLVVSCRTDFAKITVPQSIYEDRASDWARITHRGFADHLFEAVSRFFSGYRITADYFPPLLAEFRNPLFLKTVCEAYEGQRLPAGALTARNVMEQRVARLQEKLLQDIDCPPDVTRQAVELVASEMSVADASSLPVRTIRPKIDALLPGRGESQSLYRHLVSNRLLAEVGAPEEPSILVRFQYERFADFFIAESMLLKYKTLDDLRTSWDASGLRRQLADWHYCAQHAGLVRALGILLPEIFNIELPDIVSADSPPEHLLERWLSGLPWRSATSISKRSDQLLNMADQKFGGSVFLDTLLSTSTIPDHPFNALYLHKILTPFSLANRDEIWTLYVNDRTAWSEDDSMIWQLVRWSETVPINLVSDQQALLVATLLCWFCTSTRSEFRDRSTLTAIRILDQRPSVAEQLIRRFQDSNDPYVSVRVYAIAAGVAMRLVNIDGLTELAATVYETVFASRDVRASLALRDYAACTLEKAESEHRLPQGVNVADFRPPFRSRYPKLWTEKKTQTIEKKKGWERIRHSIQPESSGFYGDFGRYEMGVRVRHFQNTRRNKKRQVGRNVRSFDDMAARRYVLQRVWELGWRPGLFGDYESGLPYHGRERARVERISKKYQWIALDELLAYLSDHFHLAPDWSQDPREFRGAWQFWGRDFDPSQPFREIALSESEDETKQPWWTNYPDTLVGVASSRGRKRWVEATQVPDFNTLLTPQTRTVESHEWLNLCGYHWWEEKLPFDEKRLGRGVLKMWIHVRSFFVRKVDYLSSVRSLQGVNFWGNGIQVPEFHEAWLGEYPWGASLEDFITTYQEYDRWPATNVLPLTPTVCVYGEESANRTGLVPSPRTLEVINARWAGRGFEYVNKNGEVIMYTPDPFAGHNWTTCLIRRDALVSGLKEQKLCLIWTVLAERSCWDGSEHVTGSEGQTSGVYGFDGKKISGGITNVHIHKIPSRHAA